jgi:anti-anti-sigma factor
MPQFRALDCTVTVSDPSFARMVKICVVGELDLDAIPMLVEVTEHLDAVAPRRIVVELGGLSFAGSALPNWLARMRGRLDGGPSVTVRHPQPLVGRVLAITEMADLIDDSRSN